MKREEDIYSSSLYILAPAGISETAGAYIRIHYFFCEIQKFIHSFSESLSSYKSGIRFTNI